ncbi:PepSY domain-containing protein [Methyloterricola oryzae]|uniref:PepSY domain-containing protein n=1 Tax=Methyloterricola oryzae TaxID=1495050 RepID=UPI0005EBAAF2|nr:PepSY domain-containing protein [Methyloterricola oryzae]
MKAASHFLYVAIAATLCSPAMAGSEIPKNKAGMETCLTAALAKHAGEVIKLEYKDEKGVPTYEFEILDQAGKTWELECDANKGKITEEEQEVENGDDPRFKTKAKISLEQAKEIALKAHPGEVVETEFEIESNGDASYEFDIKTDKGEVKLEVDAATGKIIEDKQKEYYQIGKE